MDDSKCSTCSGAGDREATLCIAARYPELKGSPFVGRRGVRDLFVCRDCEAMWQTWYDQREGYQCWRAHGPTIVNVFASDTSLARLVDWVASHYDTGSFVLVNALSTRLIRRRPDGLQEGVSALLQALDELMPPEDVTAAERLSMLFHLLGLGVERAIRGDLRTAGTRVKAPTRYRDAEVEEAARHFHERGVDGLTRLPKTHDVIRRLMWESRWGKGAASPDSAVITIQDLSPILRFLEELPLGVVDDGILRGVVAESAFAASSKLHNLGRLPENDHAIWMPQETWSALQILLDPLERLAASIRRIRRAAFLTPSQSLPHLQMESFLIKEPIRQGARFTVGARRELEEIAGKTEAGRTNDGIRAHEALRTILEQEKTALATDVGCVLVHE